MSIKTTKFEKAAARMRKLEDEKRRAAEQARKQKLEVERLCGRALMDAANDGDDFGDYLDKSVAELAVAVGLLDQADEDVAEELARHEEDRVLAEALRDAASGGDVYGEFLNLSVAELAGYLGIIRKDDKAEDDGQDGEGQDGDGANAPEVDYGDATATTY